MIIRQCVTIFVASIGVRPEEGDVRIGGGSHESGTGVVEVYLTSPQIGWFTICPDPSWDSVDANVICASMGYESGEPTTFSPSQL